MLHFIQLSLYFSLFGLTLAAPLRIETISLAQPNISTLGVELVCVNRFTPWQGTLNYGDCLTARNALYNEFAPIRTYLYAFYTESSGFVPPPSPQSQSWELPLSRTFGTCTVQFRMFRDFAPLEIPTKHGRWVLPSTLPPAGISTWGSLLSDAKTILDECDGDPGWTNNGFAASQVHSAAPIGVFIWPADSDIASKYQGNLPPHPWSTLNASTVKLQ